MSPPDIYSISSSQNEEVGVAFLRPVPAADPMVDPDPVDDPGPAS